MPVLSHPPGAPDAARPPGLRLQGIEALRGAAATAVVLYHCARHLNQAQPVPSLVHLFQFGHAGVDLFFVLSGFIILFVHAADMGRPSRLLHYVGRRLSRVFPAYWVALALTVIIALAGGHAPPALSDLAWSLAILPSRQPPILGVAWTLQYEIVFYAIFAVLIWRARLGCLLLSLWAGWIALVWIGGVENLLRLPSSLYGSCNVEFFLGMGVAWMLARHRLGHPRAVCIAGLILLIAACVAEDAGSFNGYKPAARLLYGLPSALLIAGVAEGDRQHLLQTPGWLRQLGAASYSIYLLQFVMIGSVWQGLARTGLATTLPSIVIFAILAAAALAGGIAGSHLVERPLLRLLRNRRSLIGHQDGRHGP